MSFLRTILVTTIVGIGTSINYGFMSVQTMPVCTLQTQLATPPGNSNEPLLITQIAWPIGVQGVPEPLIINNQSPVSRVPELICLTGCGSPPCLPVETCQAADLYWSNRYENLVVPANSYMQLPDLPDGIQLPMLMVLYETTFPPSPLPSLSPSASPTQTPTPSPTTSQPVRPIPRQELSVTVSSPHATPAAVSFGLLFGGAIICLFAQWNYHRKVSCPYCGVRVNEGIVGLRVHLKTCADHLALYQPFVVETVKMITPQPTPVIREAWGSPATDIIEITTEEGSELLDTAPGARQSV